MDTSQRPGQIFVVELKGRFDLTFEVRTQLGVLPRFIFLQIDRTKKLVNLFIVEDCAASRERPLV